MNIHEFIIRMDIDLVLFGRSMSLFCIVLGLKNEIWPNDSFCTTIDRNIKIIVKVITRLDY